MEQTKEVTPATPETRLDILEKNIQKQDEKIDRILELLTAKTVKPEEEKKEVKPDIGKLSPSGEVNLPKGTGDQSPASKPDEEFVAKKVEEILKSHGITKTETPRPKHEDLSETHAKNKADFGMDLLKRAKEGKTTQAEMNREVKAFVKGEYKKGIAAVLREV